MKKILIGIAVTVGVLVLSFVLMMASVFAGMKKPEDGLELPGGARAVLDGYVAVFFIPTPNSGLVLVDAGNDPSGAAILAELKRRNVGPEAVKAIFLTHGHPDHTSAAHLFPAAKVLIFEGDKGIAEGTASAQGPLPKMMGVQKEHIAKITDVLKDGEVVDIDGLSVKPYLIPGHTAGSGAFLVNGVLYLGDSAAGQSDGAIRGAPWVFSDSTEVNVASVRALAKRLKSENAEVKALAFAHSGPFMSSDALFTF